MAIVILFSDCLFQKRMIFAPPFLFISLSFLFHLTIQIIHLFTDWISIENPDEWLMFVEGLLDDQVQFYIFFIAPV